ncbi:MAG TPA: aspartate-semialdehyde dehydrogenase [Candidatus Eremiobacteraceae bacterium]|nr:aspartate-semialdehyde dehydrogenase [Candidatus Eremiobacteraceae bacterium]
MDSRSKIPVAILGATGTVGQRLISLLDNHPWFALTALAASDNSVGKCYADVVRWHLPTPMPAAVRGMIVRPSRPPLDARLIFSALPTDVARQTEDDFADAGYVVSTNSSPHRMDADVPLLIPECNADQLSLVETQRKRRSSNGYIIANPNCSTIHLALALKPLHDTFGITRLMVTTMQAISGAGYPGVASMDVIDNVVPFIGGEEGKLESETQKILGTVSNGHVDAATFRLSAQCNRVMTLDGHLEAVSIEFARKPALDELRAAFADFRGVPQVLKLPSAPARPIVVRDEQDRPQPRLDRDEQGGMASVVGRIRPCQVLDYKFLVLGHNTLRGAAGGTILNAELLVAKELI